MKYRVIKEFSGIEVDSEITLNADVVDHMVNSGYVIECDAKVVTEYEKKVIEPEVKVTIDGRKLVSVLEGKKGRPRK